MGGGVGGGGAGGGGVGGVEVRALQFRIVYDGPHLHHTMDRLEANKPLCFRVSCSNDVGSSACSPVVTLCTGIAPPSKPAAPVQVVAVSRDKDMQRLTQLTGRTANRRAWGANGGKKADDSTSTSPSSPSSPSAAASAAAAHRKDDKKDDDDDVGEGGEGGEAALARARLVATSILIEWAAPGERNGSPIESYRLEGKWVYYICQSIFQCIFSLYSVYVQCMFSVQVSRSY